MGKCYDHSNDFMFAWLSFGKELLTRWTIGSLCILTILVISCFDFEGWIWVLISSVPGLCTHFTFTFTYLHSCRYEGHSFKK